MVKNSPKRQRVAEDQLESLDEFNVEQFRVFLQEYSKYIPYRQLWRIVGSNTRLVQWFNEHTTNGWWKERLQNDFYDYHDAIVESDNTTIKANILIWMTLTLEPSESHMSKPWKLAYMTCYGIFNLINGSTAHFKNNGVFGFNDLVVHNTIGLFYGVKIRGDFLLTETPTKVKISSWVASMKTKKIVKDRDDVILPIRNGILIISENETRVYDRETDTIKSSSKWTSNNYTIASPFSDLIYSSGTITHHKNLETTLSFHGVPIYQIGQDYYRRGDTIYQWPTTFVQSINELLTTEINPPKIKITGPYNFDINRFVGIYTQSGTTFVYSIGDKNENPRNIQGGEFKQFAYGFLLTNPTYQYICVPSGRYIGLLGQNVVSICGPFAVTTVGGSHMNIIDLWSTLQKALHKPFGKLSSEHCHNCGFMARIQCKECQSSFCDTDCAKEHFENPVRSISCNHESM